MNTTIQIEKTNLENKKYKKINTGNAEKILEGIKDILEGRVKEI